ncbi:MAG TPA: universal stress protein [Chloroflexi bacterium]|nr:universal stress protein [Chloroflexota bacterium]
MFKKILVPVDGSRYANRAVKMAAKLARQSQTSILLLHAIRNLSLPGEILDMISAGEVTESRLEILQDSAEIILENAGETLTQAGLTDVKTEYLIGDPAATIAEYAKQNNVDLIVLGHRGLGSQKQLLGGVARKVLNLTTIPCLIVGE